MSINSFHRLSCGKKKISRVSTRKESSRETVQLSFIQRIPLLFSVSPVRWTKTLSRPARYFICHFDFFLFWILLAFYFQMSANFGEGKKMPPKKLNTKLLNNIIFADCRILCDTCKWEKRGKEIPKKEKPPTHRILEGIKNNSFDCKWVKLFSLSKIRRNQRTVKKNNQIKRRTCQEYLHGKNNEWN